MAKLRPGAITIDLVEGGIYGDLDHEPKEVLLESAEALLAILPKIKHKGLWGLSKDFDMCCYVLTAKSYKLPEGIEAEIEVNIDKGPIVGYPKSMMPPLRPARLTVVDNSSREKHREHTWYEKVVGSVKDGHASPNTTGVTDHYRPPDYTPVAVSPVKKKEKKGPAYGQQKMF